MGSVGACAVPPESGDADTDGSSTTDPSTSASATAPTGPTTTPSTSSTASTTDATGDTSSSSGEPTTSAGCGGDDDCSDPTPHCDDAGECVQCTDHAHCESSACDLATGTCFEGSSIAVAVGYGFRRVWSGDGLEWQDFQEDDPMGGDDDALLRGIGYGDGTFVAVGGAAVGVTITSRNGADWENQTTQPSFLSDVVWLNDTFVAAGGNGLRLRSTDGGVTWGDQTGYYAGHFRGIATDGALVVAVGHTYGGGGDIGMWSTTTDGDAWTAEETGGSPFGAIAWGAGTFVAVGAGGRASASADGTTWDDQTLGAANFNAVMFDGEAFLVAGDGALWSSPDGATWTEVDPADPRPVIAHFMGGYFALGWPATIDRSDDLVAYETVFEPGGSGLTDIAVGVPGR